jgi:hypothetical protein
MYQGYQKSLNSKFKKMKIFCQQHAHAVGKEQSSPTAL